MARTIAARLAAFAATLFAASAILFLAINVIPGSAAQSALGFDATPQAVARFEAQHGLDRPWVAQYGEWLGRALHGDFGTSFQNGVPVGPDVAARLPVTLELAVLAFIVANAIALPLGTLSAIRHRRRADTAATTFATAATSMPAFWLATLLVLVFVVNLRWLPASGFTPLLNDPWRNLQQMILPALSLGVVSSGLLVRILRGSLIEVLARDYVLVARAKGTSEGEVVRGHALRNAIGPYLHVATVELGFLFGGVVVIEDIFRLPGIGALVLVGIINRDYPVLMAAALTITGFVLVANLIVDVVSVLLDPRPARVSA